MRKVELTVGSTGNGEAFTWAYPKGCDLGLFKTPIYTMTVRGTNETGQGVQQQFNVLLIALTGATGATRDDNLHAIANRRKLSIHYERALRPALMRA